MVPEKDNFTTYAGAANGAVDGSARRSPPLSWVHETVVPPSSCAEVRVPRLILPELSVVMVAALPGQPRKVAYRTRLSLLRVNRTSCAVPVLGVWNVPP